MVGRAGRDRVRPPAGRLDLPDRPLPALLEADPEPGLHQADVRAENPAEQDVARRGRRRRRASPPSSPGSAHSASLPAPRPPPPGACGSTGRRRWRRACRIPAAIASATRYSSFRILLPPKASPLLQSSRFAQRRAPPRWALSRSSGCTGDGPNRKRIPGERVELHARLSPRRAAGRVAASTAYSPPGTRRSRGGPRTVALAREGGAGS